VDTLFQDTPYIHPCRLDGGIHRQLLLHGSTFAYPWARAADGPGIGCPPVRIIEAVMKYRL